MQQTNDTNYSEVISMEEYLEKRQKIRESEKKNQKEKEKDRQDLVLNLLYI